MVNIPNLCGSCFGRARPGAAHEDIPLANMPAQARTSHDRQSFEAALRQQPARPAAPLPAAIHAGGGQHPPTGPAAPVAGPSSQAAAPAGDEASFGQRIDELGTAHQSGRIDPQEYHARADSLSGHMTDAWSNSHLDDYQYSAVTKRLGEQAAGVPRPESGPADAAGQAQRRFEASPTQLADNRAQTAVAQAGVNARRQHPEQGRTSVDMGAVGQAAAGAAQAEGIPSNPANMQRLQSVGRLAATGGLTRPNGIDWGNMRGELREGANQAHVAARYNVVHPDDVAQLRREGTPRTSPEVQNAAVGAILADPSERNVHAVLQRLNIGNEEQRGELSTFAETARAPVPPRAAPDDLRAAQQGVINDERGRNDEAARQAFPNPEDRQAITRAILHRETGRPLNA